MKKSPALYCKLFTSTFYLSAFTFGGGYVIIPLMKKKFADDLHWIEEKEMLDLTAIAQSAPGPIAVNAAILIGYRIAGVLGALTTILGTVLPPLIILSVISLFYQAFCCESLGCRAFTGNAVRRSGGYCRCCLFYGKRRCKREKMAAGNHYGRCLYCKLLFRRQRHSSDSDLRYHWRRILLF